MKTTTQTKWKVSAIDYNCGPKANEAKVFTIGTFTGKLTEILEILPPIKKIAIYEDPSAPQGMAVHAKPENPFRGGYFLKAVIP